VDAVRRCFVVANSIGRHDTVHSLIPLLDDHITNCGCDYHNEEGPNTGAPTNANNHNMSSLVPTAIDEDDEILLILAEQLGQMVLSGLVPGWRSLGILRILEKLAGVEETVVRDRAVRSIHCIIPLVASTSGNAGGIKEEEEAMRAAMRNGPALLVNMLKRLTSAEWFTAKVSACSVLPSVYQLLNTMKANAVLHLGSGMDGEGSESSQGSGTSVEETKRQLRAMFKSLAEEDSPMIRRATGKNLGRYAEAVANINPSSSSNNNNNNNNTPIDDEITAQRLTTPAAKNFIIPGKDETWIKKLVSSETKQRVLDEVVPVYQNLASDEQDSVRLLAVSSSGSLGCALGLDPDLCAKAVLPVVTAGASDLSWRVRHNLAREFAVVTQSQGYHESSTHTPNLHQLFQLFAGLLQDFEAEVRTASVENFCRMVQIGSKTPTLFTDHIVPVLPSLADDLVMEVRSKFAEALMDCCDPSLCDSVDDELILAEFKPILENFLNDEFADVQLHVLSKSHRLTRLLTKMDNVVRSILTMSKATNWRVREAVGKCLPFLTQARGVDFFKEDVLDDIWMRLLMDVVADVRASCVSGMGKLLAVTGSEWMRKEIVPRYLRIYDSSESYLTRITVLKAFAKLISLDGGDGEGDGEEGKGRMCDEALQEEVVTLILRGLEKDSVANVRIVAAQGLKEIAEKVDDGLLTSRIRPALEARTNTADEEDEDCRYFAQIALSACSG